MAWLTAGTRKYYYRRRRVGGRVLSEYVATGRTAQIVAQMDEQERQKRAAEAEALRQAQAAQDAVDREVDALGAQVRRYVTAVLLATGHHQHRRQWRKQRNDAN